MRTVTATRYVTPLREGGSLPAIVEADDDGLYVLKFRGAGQGRIEQRSPRHPDVDDQRQLPRNGRIAHQRAEPPGIRLVKFRKAQFLFLQLQPLNIAFE